MASRDVPGDVECSDRKDIISRSGGDEKPRVRTILRLLRLRSERVVKTRIGVPEIFIMERSLKQVA